MGRYDIQTLRTARHEAMALADAGLSVSAARDELRNRGMTDELAGIAIRLVSAENREKLKTKRRSGFVLGAIVCVVGLFVLSAAAGAHPSAQGQMGSIAALVLASGAGIILRNLLRGMIRGQWDEGPDPTEELGVRLSDLRGDTEVLTDAASLHNRRRRAEIIAWIAALATVFCGAVLVLPMFVPRGSDIGLPVMAVLGFIAIFIYFIVRSMLLGSEGMTTPVSERGRYAPRPAASPEPAQRTAEAHSAHPPSSLKAPNLEAPQVWAGPDYAVPRLPTMPAPLDKQVPRAPLLRPGALSIDIAPNEKDAQSGLLLFTTLGLAYLPDMQNQVMEAARMILPHVASFAAPQGVLQLLSFAEDLAGHSGDPAGWFVRALGDKRHFVIPWPELVRVRAVPADDSWVLTRQLPDGSGRDFKVTPITTDDLAALLFGSRLRFESDAIIYRHLLAPQQAIVETEERMKAAAYYGDDAGQHEADIKARIGQQLAKWLETRRDEANTLVQRELGPVLAAYAAVPGVADQRRELFGAGRT